MKFRIQNLNFLVQNTKVVQLIHKTVIITIKNWNKYKILLRERGEKKAKAKINDLRHDEASNILFGDILRIANNRKAKTREITDFFKVI